MSTGSSNEGQIISLPKGGGALHGMGEKFSPDLHTGTGNYSIPITLPSGRNGFQPNLELLYSTGHGNGPFGLGWKLNIPGVTCKTSKGVPVYDEKTVFILSGVEDLVAVSGVYPDPVRYQPRTEGLFALIERHHDQKDDFWKVQTKDGSTSYYGKALQPGDDPAIIANPNNRSRIFSWHLVETRDTFGNSIIYDYLRDKNDDPRRPWDQLYLKGIKYCEYQLGGSTKYLISVDFLYEERPDSFSEYRSGFEIRTRKRCRQIIVKTHSDQTRLVSSYTFQYLDQSGLNEDVPLNGVSLLHRVEASGYDDNGLLVKELPPLEFSYTQFDLEKRDFMPVVGPELPLGSLLRSEYEMADLRGDGLPDFFQMNGALRYWRNLGDCKFDIPRAMREAPGGIWLEDPGVQLLDADGNGLVDLLVANQEGIGYFPLNTDGGWDRRSFQPYAVAPSFSLEDPEVRLVDLDGDGLIDAIRSGTRFECFFNDADRRKSWQRTRWVERKTRYEFPDVNFSDLRVRWADMSGDGLQDIILVHDGNVEYWPNLGHGNWAPPIHMEHSPRYPANYDPKRILLGDLDGDGLADIVYVGDREVTLWLNKSGNGWSQPMVIHGTPPVAENQSIRLVDLLGTGVAGILWSSDAVNIERPNMFFLDFTGRVKPYLLGEIDNHMGAITRVQYLPSTHFYLEDERRHETRWRTPLPFPVQVVSRVEVIDHFSGGRLTTEYRYHHGYWDGVEREFRGFGMVEEFDSEKFETYNSIGLGGPDAPFTKVDEQRFSPPTLTKTWFHQGPVGNEFGDWHELNLSHEYWQEDPQFLGQAHLIEDFLKTRSRRRIKRDALRALRGHTLRSELYALDGTDR
ncbi:MAG TPA: SpvB/TcaC N-terminal domain-containing protein, partial [Pyrinomonadaceae bacterium]